MLGHARDRRSPVWQGSSHDRDNAEHQSYVSAGGRGSEVAGGRERSCSTHRQHWDSPRFVSDPTEAALFDYYVKEAGFWLDAVCPERHFSQIAPCLALSDPMLYSACLAYASLILCSLGTADKSVEEKHSGRAIRLLIDKLSNGSTTWPESSTLTTTVLLRVSEQFSEICDDRQFHLNGAFTLTASVGRVWSSNPWNLETTAFWTYLRMSVRMCFLCERSTEGDPEELVRLSDTTEGGPACEAALANQMTFLAARICNACWPATGGEVSKVVLEALRVELDNILVNLPCTFQPWTAFTQSGSLYPELKYLSSWHTIFWQFFHAADVLLAVNAALLSPQPTLAAQSQYAERNILRPTRDLLAVTYSNHEVGVQINAAALAAWCGQFLTRAEEQKALLDWLSQLSADTSWPCATVTGRLARIWAGEQTHWTRDPG